MSLREWSHPSADQHLLWSEVRPLLPAVFIVLLIGALLEPLVGHHAVGIFFLIVIALSGLFIRRYALLLVMAMLLGVSYHYVLFPPMFSFTFYRPEDLKTVIALYIAAVLIGGLVQKLRRQALTLQAREDSMRLHYELARQLTQTRSLEEVAELAVSTLSRLLNQTIALYLLKKETQGTQVLWHAASTLQQEAQDRQQLETFAAQSDVSFQIRHTRSARTYFPLLGRQGLVGIVLVSRRITLEQRQDRLRTLETFMSQIAVAMEREILHERSKQLELFERTQLLYRTLFNSVSHELKTPLVAITGSASAMLDPDTMRDPAVGPLLAHEILTASQRLCRVVDNLLDMSRVDSGMLRPKIQICDFRDVLAVLIQKLDAENYQNPIALTIEANIPEIALDPVLFEQALFNILHNAHNYTSPGTTVEVKVGVYQDRLRTCIRDHGPGLPSKDPQQVFAKFYRGSPQNAGGLGLGLSIAQGFIEALDGSILARNHPEGGAEFIIDLPIERPPR